MAAKEYGIKFDCTELKRNLLDFEAKVIRARQEEADAKRNFWIDVLNTPTAQIASFFLGVSVTTAILLAYAVLTS